MTISLSLPETRKLALQSQRLYSRHSFGGGVEGTLNAIQHLGYVQIDTLSVVARAHLHTLWNRVAGFSQAHIDQLQENRKIFEYWAHALAILPMTDYRYALPRMNRIASGETHWYPKDSKQTNYVLRRIRAEGPLSAKDFNDKKSSKEMWALAPSKIALEQLFMEGKLMIARRRNFHKVYELRERVLPDDVDTRIPGDAEYCRHLISSYLRSHGLGQVKETIYLRKGMGPLVRQVAKDMVEENLLATVQVDGREYLCFPSALEWLETKTPRARLRILSPFDNAIIQRRRMNELFAFDYQIECYVPKAKRRFGYYCLPILQSNKLVARMDAKASRKDKVFHILHLHLEKSVRSADRFFDALWPELQKFVVFNDCETIRLHRITGCDASPQWARTDPG